MFRGWRCRRRATIPKRGLIRTEDYQQNGYENHPIDSFLLCEQTRQRCYAVAGRGSNEPSGRIGHLWGRMQNFHERAEGSAQGNVGYASSPMIILPLASRTTLLKKRTKQLIKKGELWNEKHCEGIRVRRDGRRLGISVDESCVAEGYGLDGTSLLGEYTREGPLSKTGPRTITTGCASISIPAPPLTYFSKHTYTSHKAGSVELEESRGLRSHQKELGIGHFRGRGCFCFG